MFICSRISRFIFNRITSIGCEQVSNELHLPRQIYCQTSCPSFWIHLLASICMEFVSILCAVICFSRIFRSRMRCTHANVRACMFVKELIFHHITFHTMEIFEIFSFAFTLSVCLLSRRDCFFLAHFFLIHFSHLILYVAHVNLYHSCTRKMHNVL